MAKPAAATAELVPERVLAALQLGAASALQQENHPKNSAPAAETPGNSGENRANSVVVNRLENSPSARATSSSSSSKNSDQPASPEQRLRREIEQQLTHLR